ncbi:hypothetical protein GALL_75960 [mine drainage metagenome]|uniref:MetA-pathway of phenol degradation n=1 Tax=mine drainage metagenome TaxID=410659 RepID=A0A1J5T3J9_9ZZZZ
MRFLRTLALFVFSTIGSLAFALPDELYVQMDETTKPGEFSIDVLSSYVVAGPVKPSSEALQPAFHLLQASPDFSYGIKENTQIDLQLFSSIGLNGESRVEGARAELLNIPVRPDTEGDEGLFIGELLEVGHLPPTYSSNNLDAEFKAILGYRSGRLTFATNPEIGFKISGNGSSQPDISIKLKVAYQIDEEVSCGIEHYGDLGQVNYLSPYRQLQQTFAVVDMKNHDTTLNVGVGRGWNDYSDQWTIKTNFSFPFGK